LTTLRRIRRIELARCATAFVVARESMVTSVPFGLRRVEAGLLLLQRP
jgi:hypothetical protein